jgi:hypothetical protein
VAEGLELEIHRISTKRFKVQIMAPGLKEMTRHLKEDTF